MTHTSHVTVPVADLERVRDLLMERVHGSPARSPAHNARLEVEAMLSEAPVPEGEAVLADACLTAARSYAETNDDYMADLLLKAATTLATRSDDKPGGAVDDLRRLLGDAICYGCSRRYGDNSEAAIRDARGCVSCKAARSALATREEAPAEAGEVFDNDVRDMTFVELILRDTLRIGTGTFDGVRGSFIANIEEAARHIADKAERLVSALRAQPQARSGKVTWHSSGEDEGPDVSLQLDLGDGRSLWLGEGQKPTGWQFSLVHGDDITPIADVIDHEHARDLFDCIASAVQPQAREDAQPVADRVSFEWSYHEDDNRYPRDFWHVRATIGSLSTDWLSVGKQEQRELSDDEKAEGEKTVLRWVEGSITHPAPDALRVAVSDIAVERQRQVDAEGWATAQDDGYADAELAKAAAAYTLSACGFTPDAAREMWPRSWSARWWKPTTARRDLVKAGALIVAEIERLDRAALQAEQKGGA